MEQFNNGDLFFILLRLEDFIKDNKGKPSHQYAIPKAQRIIDKINIILANTPEAVSFHEEYLSKWLKD